MIHRVLTFIKRHAHVGQAPRSGDILGPIPVYSGNEVINQAPQR